MLYCGVLHCNHCTPRSVHKLSFLIGRIPNAATETRVLIGRRRALADGDVRCAVAGWTRVVVVRCNRNRGGWPTVLFRRPMLATPVKRNRKEQLKKKKNGQSINLLKSSSWARTYVTQLFKYRACKCWTVASFGTTVAPNTLRHTND